MKIYSRLSSAAVMIGALRVKGVLEVVGWVTLPDSNHNESEIFVRSKHYWMLQEKINQESP